MFKYLFSLSSAIYSILFGIFLQKMAVFMTLPFIPIFLAKNTYLNPTEIGFIVGVSPLAGICASFFGGYLSDILGRKKILILTVLASTCILFSYFLSTKIESMQLKILSFTLLSVLSGVSAGVFEPVASAFLSDLATPELKGVIFQLRYFSLNLGASIGPMLGLLLNSNGTSSSFLYAGFLYSIYFFVFLILMQKNYPQNLIITEKRVSFKQSCSIISQDRKMLFLILTCILIIFCYNQITTTFSQIMHNEVKGGIEKYSFYLTANGLLVLLIQGPLYQITRKIGLNNSLSLGSVLLTIGFFVLTFNLNSLYILILSILLITSGEVLVFPISNELIDTFAPKHMRGAYFGASAFKNFGLVFGPIGGGFIYFNFGSNYLFIFLAFISFIAPFVFFYGQKEKGVEKIKI